MYAFSEKESKSGHIQGHLFAKGGGGCFLAQSNNLLLEESLHKQIFYACD